MLKLARHKQFKKDLARIGKRGWDLWELFQVMTKLAAGQRLGPEYKTHTLSGEYEGFSECHVGGDFLLIWYVKGDEIFFVRTGNHADLFDT
jgi:mRNA interferase YafQ